MLASAKESTLYTTFHWHHAPRLRAQTGDHRLVAAKVQPPGPIATTGSARKDHHCSHCSAWSNQRAAAQRGDGHQHVECERSSHEPIVAAAAPLGAIDELLLREAVVFHI